MHTTKTFPILFLLLSATCLNKSMQKIELNDQEKTKPATTAKIGRKQQPNNLTEARVITTSTQPGLKRYRSINTRDAKLELEKDNTFIQFAQWIKSIRE